jgi:hypothetical protein
MGEEKTRLKEGRQEKRVEWELCEGRGRHSGGKGRG